MNLRNPRYYTEKIQWVKLYDRKEQYHTYVDKYAVRKVVNDLIGEEYLISLIGVYDSADDIEWDKLPNRFEEELERPHCLE